MNILKVLFISILLIYVNFFEATKFTNVMDAALTLIFSILLLWRSRKNLPVSLVAIFILYCNYSICMGEYFIGGRLGVPVYEVKTVDNYGISIRILLIFIGIVSIFYNGKSVSLSKFRLVPKDNILIFYSLYLALVYVLLFEVNRGDLSSYSVRITPIYEYSSLLFILAYYYSGKSMLRRTLMTILFTLFILQDFYYGGRITSTQLLLLFLVTIFLQKLSFKFVLLGGFVGIFLNNLVGVYRRSHFHLTNIWDIFISLKNGYFVFDTPVYAFYGSATHVAAAKVAGFDVKLSSLTAFIVSIFLGSKNEISNLTTYISNHYYRNMGGGILPTHFYFWLGWAGVVLIAVTLILFLNKLDGSKNDYQKLCSIMVIITIPRWYLYSPLSLFRPLILLSVLYLIFSVSHKILSELPSRNRANYLKPIIHEL